MNKNLTIGILTIAVAILLYLLFTHKADVVVAKVIKRDTVFCVEQLPPDTIIKRNTKIVYQEIPIENQPVNDSACDFVVNLFEKNTIHLEKFSTKDIAKYIVTKPFEVIDTIFTKKRDTIITRFELTIQNPGTFTHFNYYAPDTTKIIHDTVQIEPQKHWYDSDYFRYGCIVGAFVGGAYLGIKAGK
jgi:hypothetical protein